MLKAYLAHTIRNLSIIWIALGQLKVVYRLCRQTSARLGSRVESADGRRHTRGARTIVPLDNIASVQLSYDERLGSNAALLGYATIADAIGARVASAAGQNPLHGFFISARGCRPRKSAY